MADNEFNPLLQQAGNHFLPWDKLKNVKKYFNNTSYHFITEQVRQLLSILTDEIDRLEMAKLSYSRVTDWANFHSCTTFLQLSPTVIHLKIM